MIIYISGGARSGKSRFAQEMALRMSPNPVYLATARVWDDDFQGRIRRHQEERGPEWTTFEGYKNLHLLPLAQRVVVIDCVTLWLANFFHDHKKNIEQSLRDYKQEIRALKELPATFIIISNEIGMGIHASEEVSRKFTDLQGWANQFTASVADKAIFMVSGLPLYLKEKNRNKLSNKHQPQAPKNSENNQPRHRSGGPSATSPSHEQPTTNNQQRDIPPQPGHPSGATKKD